MRPKRIRLAALSLLGVALFIACLVGHLASLRQWRNSLHSAAARGDAVAVQRLLASNVDVNERAYGGRTALHVASELGRADMARLLLENGGDVNAKEAFGQTPLFYATRMGQRDIADILLRAGADPNVIDVDGTFPLDYASGEIEELLLHHGATNRSRIVGGHWKATTYPSH